MKRRNALILSTVILGAAGLVAVLGLVMSSNADFARTYTRDQLAQQKISFPPVERLSAKEKQVPCLVRYAGQALSTGKQAECYANEFIGLHVKQVAGGKTYAELGVTERALLARVTEAEKAGAPDAAELRKQHTALKAQRTSLFEGETSRGLLLTSFGFSELGAKADQAATTSYAAAALLLLLSLVSFARVTRRPQDEPGQRRVEHIAPFEIDVRQPVNA